MKTIKPICLLITFTGNLMLSALGQSERTDINPALIYYRAFLVAPNLSQEDKDYLFTNQWRSLELPPRFGRLMDSYGAELNLVRQAAHSTVPCDWGIDMAPGPATLLPHLARVKAVTLATRLRVLWHLQQGGQTEARDELLGAFALGRNASRDGTLISTLVQIANETIDCSTIAENFGRFSPETLKQLVEGLETAPTRRTVADCLSTEKAFFLDWAVNKVEEVRKQNPGDDAKAMAGIRGVFSGLLDQPEEGLTNGWERLTQAAGGTSAGIVNVLHETEPFLQKLSALLVLPYSQYTRQMPAFAREAEHSPNPVVSAILPAWVNSRPKELRGLTYLAMVRAAVAYKLHGEAGLQSVADPCGEGPFAFRRFVFEGVDRGFELKSAYDMNKNKAVLIFVEKEGPAFQVSGNYPGTPVTAPAPAK